MKCVKITPRPLKGKIEIPPSKSMSHRAVICAALSEGISNIDNIAFSKDILATLEGMNSFGTDYKVLKENIDTQTNKIAIDGNQRLRLVNREIDCIESGSTLRFIIPIACLLGEDITLTGRGKLVERPLDSYYKIFDKEGIKYSNDNNRLPLKLNGKLKPGNYELDGNVSSQFITGLMFALPLLHGDSKITITTELESKGYVDLTIDVLKKYSIEVENNNYREFHIKGNQKYECCDYRVEGDFSQAAFWIVAGILGGSVICSDLNIDSKQGDKAILDIVEEMGSNLIVNKDYIQVDKSKTKGTTVDASQCPDIVPILATLACVSKGTTKIINASRLRIKESDRLKAISTELNKLGASIVEREDSLIINGVESLTGGIVNSWNDHRIAMALAVASIKCKDSLIIENSEAIEKSYPNFFEDFVKLGGEISEYNRV